MPVAQSALVVFVPEADPIVEQFRDRYDPSAAAGCAAHVTLLYPFKPPEQIDRIVLATLGRCFAQHSPFRLSLRETRRFPGVLYLAPEPDEPYRRLTRAIWDLYPETPPYAGRHSDIVPHLCVAQLADERRLDAVAEEFSRASKKRPPIEATAADVTLIDTRSGSWQICATFKLGSQSRDLEKSH